MTAISLDNDLGYDNVYPCEGRHVAAWIEEAAYNNTIPRCRVTIHSANPVAREYMETAIKNAQAYWDKHEENQC